MHLNAVTECLSNAATEMHLLSQKKLFFLFSLTFKT